MKDPLQNMDVREIELPTTVFVRDIETRVLQGIVLQILANIEGISLLEGNLFDSLLSRNLDRVRGVHVEQKKHSVEIRVEINIAYGVSIPEKAEEVQTKLSQEVSRWTGLHVASVHVVFKELIAAETEELATAP